MISSRHAIVTGGSSGVGVAIVASLLRTEGVGKVFVTGQKPLHETALSGLLTDQRTNDRVLYSAGDTGDSSVVERQYAEAVGWFGGQPPGALFLNAGIGGGRYELERFDVERFDAIFRVNTRGPFLWLRTVLPALKEQKDVSQVVVTSSVAALRGIANGGPYAASKWAVNGLVLSLREELKSSHPQVKCGLVCPGPIATSWLVG